MRLVLIRWALAGGILAVCAGAAPFAGVARADSATEAKLRFDHGLELSARGKVQEALNEFFTSNRLSANSSVMFNIAASLAYLGRFNEAFSAYSEYLAQDLSPTDRAEGEKALARIL